MTGYCIIKLIFAVVCLISAMDGIPIFKKEAGRDGLGVEYLVNLETMQIIDYISL